MTAASLVIQYWVKPEKINPGVFITVFLIAIVTLNYIGVKYFGEFEFWLSSLKVVVICGLILLSLILALGGGPTHDRTGFRYWKTPGAFHAYIMTGSAGKFLGFWSSMVTAVFAYLGKSCPFVLPSNPMINGSKELSWSVSLLVKPKTQERPSLVPSNSPSSEFSSSTSSRSSFSA